MENTESELVISYVYDYNDFKKTSFHPTSLPSILCCNIIPIISILLFELIMVIVCLNFGFSERRVFSMIVIPSIYGLIILLYYPIYFIMMKIEWNRIRRLPLEQKWIFTKEGVIEDKTYLKTFYRWEEIQKAIEGKDYFFFTLINSKLIKIGSDPLFNKDLKEEEYKSLKTILLKYLGREKVQFRNEKKTI